jgi:hypothetical protein
MCCLLFSLVIKGSSGPLDMLMASFPADLSREEHEKNLVFFHVRVAYERERRGDIDSESRVFIIDPNFANSKRLRPSCIGLSDLTSRGDVFCARFNRYTLESGCRLSLNPISSYCIITALSERNVAGAGISFAPYESNEDIVHYSRNIKEKFEELLWCMPREQNFSLRVKKVLIRTLNLNSEQMAFLQTAPTVGQELNAFRLRYQAQHDQFVANLRSSLSQRNICPALSHQGVSSSNDRQASEDNKAQTVGAQAAAPAAQC